MASFDELDKLSHPDLPNKLMTSEQLAEAQEIIVSTAKASPAFRRFAPKYHHGNTIAHPWEAIGHRMWAAMLCVLGAQGKMKVYGTHEDSNAHMMTMIGGLLSEATVYLWSPEIEKLANAAPLPKHVLSRTILSSPTMFWSISKPTTGTSWTALIHAISDVIVVGEGVDESSETCLGVRAVRYGDTWPNDFNDHADQLEKIGMILKRCAFLNSPYVMTAPHKMPRHVRRQAERAGEDVREHADEPVHVVKLRRLQMRKPQQGAQQHTGGVEWKHHWWVNAFYRAQWYPSEQAHKVIWIEPFLKGDLSKPLLEKVYAVVR
jgi:hypothetical protein